MGSLASYVVDIKSSGPKLSGWDIGYYQRDFLHRYYGLSDTSYVIDPKTGLKVGKKYSEQNHPLTLSNVNAQTRLFNSNMWRQKSWEFRTYKIHETNGISLMEWLSLPPYISEAILEDLRFESMAMKSVSNGDNSLDVQSSNDPEVWAKRGEELLMERSRAMRKK